MSRLPQPGDALKAGQAMNARMSAGVGLGPDAAPTVSAGEITFENGEMSGPGALTFRMLYGDLFDAPEVLVAALSALEGHRQDIDAGADVMTELVALGFQMAALGVLMERLRWERDR